MTKLEELIKELCPNGVRFVALEEVCDFNRGTPITSKDAVPGEVPVISGGQKPAFYHNVANRKANSITIAGSGAYAGFISYWLEPIFCADSFTVDVKDENILNKSYLYHFLLNKQEYIYGRKQGAGIPHVHGKDIARLQIPLPPLAVQREVVRILDKFTLLSQELAAELAARRVQYNYYRDRLLSFNLSIKRVPLKEIFNTRNGYTPSTNNKELWDGDIPWFRIEDIRLNGRILNESLQHISRAAVKGKPFPANSIIISTSATIGEHALITCESVANQRFTYLMLKEQYKSQFDIKFLFYYCYILDEYCRNNLNQGNFASVDMAKFNNFEFPIPPLEVQERIVKVLDNFDAICSDLGIGLPAEIEKRQQQYEYYRDKLLTFDTASATIFTDRQTDRQTGLIKLLQYVYGYVFVRLGDIAEYSCDRIDAKTLTENTYVGVDNLLPERQGKTISAYVPADGRCIKFDVGNVLIGNIRPYLKKIWFADCSGGTNGDVLVIKADTDYIVPKFLYYVLASDKFFQFDMQHSKGAKMPRGNKSEVLKYTFALPTKERQREIVEILDRFDKLCNDLSEGLPAEIEARQKQYEYYRDKLLRF